MQLTGRGMLTWLGVVALLATARVSLAQTAPLEAPAAEVIPSAKPDPPPTPKTSRVDVTAGTDVAEYADTDHVFVFTPSIAGTLSSPTAGWSVSGSYLVDVVSAASVDIVSTASRRWEEVRNEGALSGSFRVGSFSIGANALVSSEPDYLSLNGGVSISQDLREKTVTWLAAYNYGHDVAGRTGTPFSVFSHEIDRHSLKAGLTLVVNEATIASLIADAQLELGDTSKPYRYIPLFAPGVYVPVGASVDEVTALRASERPLEQLPLSRARFAATGRVAHRFRTSTLRMDERLYDDTWGLKASTTDARWLLDAGRFELGPHARVHAQTAVDFWQRAYVLLPGFIYPAFRTGDRELGPLVSITAGGSVQAALGPKARPRQWRIGLDLNAIYTRFLDDLYITERLSFVGGVSLETER